MALGTRVKLARLERGLTLQQLADRANSLATSTDGSESPLSSQTIHVLESRDSSRSKYAGLLAKALGVRLQWLSDGELPIVDSNNGPSAMYTLTPIEEWDDDTPLDDDEVEIPLLTSAEFSSGNGRTGHVIDAGEKLRFGKRTLRKAGVDKAAAAGGKNVGRSNEPLIQDGAIVMIDKSKLQIVEGEPYAIDHKGEFRVKFLYKTPGGGLRLRSYNSEEFPDENYGPDWPNEITILGWVWTWAPPIRKWRG